MKQFPEEETPIEPRKLDLVCEIPINPFHGSFHKLQFISYTGLKLVPLVYFSCFTLALITSIGIKYTLKITNQTLLHLRSLALATTLAHDECTESSHIS